MAIFLPGMVWWAMLSGDRIPVLDHGYIKLIETWGSDKRVIQCARTSTDKDFRGWGPKCKLCGVLESEYKLSRLSVLLTLIGNSWLRSLLSPCPHEFVSGDEKLLKYLWGHRHTGPFEMAGMLVEIKAPIFVFRQWQRHRTMSYNEMSARYVEIPNLHYIPTITRIMQVGNNKQNKGSKVVDIQAAKDFQKSLARQYEIQETHYQDALDSGISRELARMSMPVGRYSVMVASSNLLNWLRFMTLRNEKHAQWEIRQYALVVGSFINKHFPRTWEQFNSGQ